MKKPLGMEECRGDEELRISGLTQSLVTAEKGINEGGVVQLEWSRGQAELRTAESLSRRRGE